MRRIAIIIGIVLIVAAGTARPGMFPAEITYRIYVYGELAGKNVVKITEKGDMVIFESRTELEYEEFKLDLRCRTELERDGLKPRYFSYEGIRAGQAVSGTVWIDGDSVTGDLRVGEATFPASTRLRGQTVFFENYIIEHQTLLLNTVSVSDEPFQRLSLFFPIDFSEAPCVALVESEVEIDTTPRSVCKKYQFSIRSGSGFFGYFDPKRKLAVYMDFPSTNTEVFLEEAFGDTPLTKYTRPDPSP